MLTVCSCCCAIAERCIRTRRIDSLDKLRTETQSSRSLSLSYASRQTTSKANASEHFAHKNSPTMPIRTSSAQSTLRSARLLAIVQSLRECVATYLCSLFIQNVLLRVHCTCFGSYVFLSLKSLFRCIHSHSLPCRYANQQIAALKRLQQENEDLKRKTTRSQTQTHNAPSSVRYGSVAPWETENTVPAAGETLYCPHFDLL